MRASESGLIASSRQAARAVGHDAFAGGTAHKTHERKRLGPVVGRQDKLRALKKAGGLKVRAPWRTGVVPSGSHGAGVIGLTDAALMKLRSSASELVGARKRSPFTPARRKIDSVA